MVRRIADMVVVITGASSGIGAALARQLGRQGAKLVLAARRLDRLEALDTELGGGHLCVRTDVAVAADCAALVAAAHARFGRIDTLVCNAGYGIARSVAQTSHEEMVGIFQTNVLGTTDCVHAAVPIMEKQELRDGWRGQIVIVSSAAARRGLPYLGAYSATKSAQMSLAEALRVELRPGRIAVTSVHPVGTETEFFTATEALSGVRMPPRKAVEVYQPADVVAERMVCGIRRPRPEVWPFRPVRWALLAAMMFPRAADTLMARHRRELRDSGGGP